MQTKQLVSTQTLKREDISNFVDLLVTYCGRPSAICQKTLTKLFKVTIEELADSKNQALLNDEPQTSSSSSGGSSKSKAQKRIHALHESFIDCNFSEDFIGFIKDFQNKPLILLLASFVKFNILMGNKNKIALSTFSLDKNNFDGFSTPPLSDFFTLKIDLTDLDLHQLHRILSRYKFIYNIELSGAYNGKPEDLEDFLDSLTNYDFVACNRSINVIDQSFADKLSYRNILIRQLDIKVNDKLDIWDQLLKKWIALLNYRVDSTQNVLTYNKLFNTATMSGCYDNYIENVFDPEKTVEPGVYSNNENNWGRNVEHYSIINASVSGMETLFLEKLLTFLAQSGLEDDMFYLNRFLDEAELEILGEWISQYKNKLPFAKLMLFVNEETIKNKHFLKLLVEFKVSSLSELALVISDKNFLEIASSLGEITNQNNIHYPIQLCVYPIINANCIPENAVFYYQPEIKEAAVSFVKSICKNIQKKNQNCLNKFTTFKSESLVDEEENLEPKNDNLSKRSNKFSKKIPLKALIYGTNESDLQEDFRDSLQIQVQHVEQEIQTEETQENINVQITEEHTIAANFETTTTAVQYDGSLVNHDKFQSQPYYALSQFTKVASVAIEGSKTELFSDLPYGISGVSPAAAKILAINIQKCATLNLDNLPEKFQKKVQNKKWIIDYDSYTEESSNNIFTPKLNFKPTRREPIYDSTDDFCSSSIVNECLTKLKKITVNRELIYCFRDYPHSRFASFSSNSLSLELNVYGLQPLWINYGDEGVQTFVNELEKIEQMRKGFGAFILEHYLAYFEDFNEFFDPDFFYQLGQVTDYEDAKYNCLCRFLIDTGASRHDLKDTLTAFNFFWSELKSLCSPNKLWKISFLSSTPEFGDPVVYMERLLKILKNARSADEQLDHLDRLSLEHYGPFSASNYENFKLVSEEMELTPDKPSMPLVPEMYYTVSLDGLYKNAISNTLILRDLYRYIGQKSHGILLKDFIDIVKTNVSSQKQYSEKLYLLFLVFATNDRYNFNLTKANNLLNILNEIEEKEKELFTIILGYLIEFFKENIQLNLDEGSMLFELINYVDFERPASSSTSNSALNGKLIVSELFEKLKQNKNAILEFASLLKILENSSPEEKKSILPWFINTLRCLESNLKVTQEYKEDLILFALLISTDIRHEKIDLLNQIISFLKQASCGENLVFKQHFDYAFKLTLQTKKVISATDFLNVCKEIFALKQSNFKEVFAILTKNNFKIPQEIPEKLEEKSSSTGIKKTLIYLICIVEIFNEINPTESDLNDSDNIRRAFECKLQKKDFSLYEQHERNDLYEKFKSILPKTNDSLNQFEKVLALFSDTLSAPLVYFDDFEIHNEKLNTLLRKNLFKMTDFKLTLNNLSEQLDLIPNKCKTILNEFQSLSNESSFKFIESAFFELFNRVDFSRLSFFQLNNILMLVKKMGSENYIGLLDVIFKHINQLTTNEELNSLLRYVKDFHEAGIPETYTEKLTAYYISNLKNKNLSKFHQDVLNFYKKYPDDLIKYIFLIINSDPKYTIERMTNLLAILKMTDVIENSNALKNLFNCFHDKKILATCLEQFNEKKSKILIILTKSYTTTSTPLLPKTENEFIQLIHQLKTLTESELNQLSNFYNISAPNFPALQHFLKQKNNGDNFEEILKNLEFMPFGERDLAKQFSMGKVEEIINGLTDIHGKKYSYFHRKQLMEAFWFVNDIGHKLPIYSLDNSNDMLPASVLSNQDIKKLIDKYKKQLQSCSDLYTKFQIRLLLLGLIREAMYLSKDKFLNEMQVIALINNCLMPGDHTQQINQGEGKSIISVVQSVLLLFEGEDGPVDNIAPSLIDANRDLQAYIPFYKFIGVRYNPKVVLSKSPFEDYESSGINHTTEEQITLLRLRAYAQHKHELLNFKRASCVMTEVDFTTLDQQTIFRYSSSKHIIGNGNEWIYYAINEFIEKPSFKNPNNNAQEDILLFRFYLKEEAKKNRKSPEIINKLEDLRLLIWIESALRVKYLIEENVHYVISPEKEIVTVNGVKKPSSVIKLLTKNHKVSQYSEFGNDVKPLLYAKLNKEKNSEEFVILEGSESILSSNNKNFIEFYLSRKGFVWGSSGTPGSPSENEEQDQKYGLELAVIPPHHKPKATHHKPIIEKNEKTQFESIFKRVNEKNPSRGMLIFCKNINKAKEIYTRIQQHCPRGVDTQLYTGIEKEQEIVTKAANPNVITVTTRAMGRNTDILYNREIGMDQIQTHPESDRDTGQMTGRTTREGSPTDIYYIYNTEDLSGQTIEEIQKRLDKQGAKEREFNETLYDILGIFYDHILKQKSQANFPEELKNKAVTVLKELFKDLEQTYRESYFSDFDLSLFKINSLQSFNKRIMDFSESLSSEQFESEWKKRKNRKTIKNIENYSKNVRLEDCIEPSIISYNYMVNLKNNSTNYTTQNTLKNNLNDVISSKIKKIEPYYPDKNLEDNISYLLTKIFDLSLEKALKEKYQSIHHQLLLTTLQSDDSVVMSNLSKIHRNFIKQLCSLEIKNYALLPLWEKIFFVPSHLNKILESAYYPLVARALSSMFSDKNSSSNDTLSVFSQSIIGLLDEYIFSSWFVNAERISQVETIKAAIQNTGSIDEILNIVSTQKLSIINSDIDSNRTSFWRSLKPINQSGKSRLQITLDNVWVLKSMLEPEKNVGNGTSSKNEAPLESSSFATSPLTTKAERPTLTTKNIHSIAKLNSPGVTLREMLKMLNSMIPKNFSISETETSSLEQLKIQLDKIPSEHIFGTTAVIFQSIQKHIAVEAVEIKPSSAMRGR